MTAAYPFTGNPDQYRLGETRGPHRLEDLASSQDGALALARQARRSLRIFSRDLDARLLGTDAFVEAASEMARRSRHTFIRILVQDPGPAVRGHHPLIRLIQGLPSHVEARRVAAEWSGEACAILIADNHGLHYRPYGDRFEGTIDFAAGADAVQYRDWFDDVWERSVPEREFRRLGI
jgi:hypothetical protein